MVETFRKRPFEVETVLWDGTAERAKHLVCWTNGKFHVGNDGAATLWNDQEHCRIACPVGHRVVRGRLGEFYPISPAAVAETYQPVPVPAAAGLSTRTFAGMVWQHIDGDTVDVLLDLDVFDQWLMRRFRLLGCNAIELRRPGGREARDNLAAMLPRGTEVTVTSVKVDKYGGRYDATVTLPDGRDLATVLIGEGWACQWNGRGVAPTPAWPRVAA